MPPVQMLLLKDIVVMFGLAVVVALVCHRLKIPTVVGLILTGVIAGPHGLGLTTEIDAVEMLAEVGVMFLLFTIGLEFSIASIAHVRRLFFVGGPLQVGITALVVFGICATAGIGTSQAILFGFIASLSSTAIILRILQERSELTSPHGKGALAILIFQDIAFVPMMLLIPFLAGIQSENVWREVAVLVGKIAAIWLVIGLAAPRLVPRVLTRIARTGSNELFLLSLGVLCFFVAWLTSLAGLSLALGAFLAGLVLSDSEHSHRALERVRGIFVLHGSEPSRRTLLSVFHRSGCRFGAENATCKATPPTPWRPIREALRRSSADRIPRPLPVRAHRTCSGT